MPSRPAFLLAAGVVAALALSTTARAEVRGISLAPVLIELDTPRRVATLTVTNNTDRPLSLQSEVRTWRQENGADRYEETDDLVVVPALATVPPNNKQVFRIALAQRVASPVERAYRLILEDIGGDSARTNEVSFRLTHDLPVLVAPSEVRQGVEWASCDIQPPADTAAPTAPGPRERCIRISNQGNRRIQISRLILSSDGSEQVVALPIPQSVLAGSSRNLRVPLDTSRVSALAGVQLATPAGQLLKAQASTPHSH